MSCWSAAWAGAEINEPFALSAAQSKRHFFILISLTTKHPRKLSRVFVYNPVIMRKFLFILVLFLGAAFIYLSFGELESIARTLQYGNFWFLLLAVLIEFGWLVVAGLILQSLYHALDMHDSVYRLSLLSISSTFVNVIAPSIGMGGMAFFVSHAVRNGQPAGKVTVVNMLWLFLDYVAFVFVLALGLIVLFRRNDLGSAELAASGIMFAIATGLGFLLYLGSRSGEALGNVLAKLARWVNRIIYPFLQRPYLNEARAYEFAHEMASDLRSLPERFHNLFIPLLYALVSKALLMCVLLTMFLAFKVPFSAGTIIGGFTISYLFLIISPTPAGVGIIEGVMPLALSSLRVPWSQAVVITLAYRGITFWLPLGFGAVAFRILEREKR
jgi:glycosyltransferase 2 family protein